MMWGKIVFKTFFQPAKSALQFKLDPLHLQNHITHCSHCPQGAQGIHGLYLCGYLQEGQESHLHPGS